MKAGLIINFSAACLISANAVKMEEGSSDLAFLLADDYDPKTTPTPTEGTSDLTAALDKAAEEEKSLEQIKANEEGFFLIVMEEILRRDAEEAAAKEAGTAMPEEEPVPEDQISTALFDLEEHQFEAIQAMEDEIAQVEDKVKADASEAADEVADVIPETVTCDATVEAYRTSISALEATLDAANGLINTMADSLSVIDPNMENGEEGKAFIKKMYKVVGQKPTATAAQMPETPMDCVTEVAGKVIMVEELQEDIDEATSLRDYFASVYCQAYANSLVTFRDGLSQIFPGGLDGSIEDEFVRMQAANSDTMVSIDELELSSLSIFIQLVEGGMYMMDETTLLDVVEPVPEAMAMCGELLEQQVVHNMLEREDYVNDFNFLKFLMAY